MISAFGKAIVLGEHAVVYGHPAVAGALARGVRCRIAATRAAGPIRVRISPWDVEVTTDDDHAIAVALRALVDAVGCHDVHIDIDVEAELPPAAGLGSSAALSVALVRALARAANLSFSHDDVERCADAAERCFHSRPSGIDVALATRGGFGVFRRGSGLEPIDAPPLPVAVGLSGEPRKTAEIVERVARARQTATTATDAMLGRLGEAAMNGVTALGTGDLGTLGELMNEAHHILGELGVSSAGLDALASSARQSGALGAKLTGAGGGGAVIAIGDVDAIAAAWRAAGFDAFTCDVGVRS